MNEQKVCVVAGAGSGVGFAVASRFSREGFAVALLARTEKNVVDLAARLTAAGGVAKAYAVDLADAAAITSTFATVERDLGSPQVLVYNAANWRTQAAMATPPASFQQDLAICATGALVCAQAVFPAMQRRHAGTILFTGGGLALHPQYGAGVASLTAGKSALRGLTFALAKELEPEGIHVATVTIGGTVAPGTSFDPQLIAERYWQLHSEAAGAWRQEIVFTGRD